MDNQQIIFIVTLIIICFSSYKGAELFFRYRSDLIDKQIKKSEHEAALKDKQDERNFLLQLLADKKVKTSNAKGKFSED